MPEVESPNHPPNRPNTSPYGFSQLRKAVESNLEVAKASYRKDFGSDPPRLPINAAVNLTRLELENRLDKKTGLRSAETFEAETHIEMAKVNRSPGKHGLVVGMLDLDNFGVYNSSNGHAKGDEALREAAKNITRSLRETDITGRIGGEEFAFAVPYDKESPAESRQTDEQHNISAERIRESLKTTMPEHITGSIGFTEFVPGEDYSECFERANHANLVAKITGKNRTVKCEDRGGVRYFIDTTNNIEYRSVINQENRKILTLEDTTNNVIHMIDYISDKKPILKEIA